MLSTYYCMAFMFKVFTCFMRVWKESWMKSRILPWCSLRNRLIIYNARVGLGYVLVRQNKYPMIYGYGSWSGLFSLVGIREWIGDFRVEGSGERTARVRYSVNDSHKFWFKSSFSLIIIIKHIYYRVSQTSDMILKQKV